MPSRSRWLTAWAVAIAAAVAVRLWNALTGPTMWGYDAWGHVAYVIFVDLYRGVPWADQGWSYFHPPLYYALAASLATFGSGDVLMRGLALIGSAASLGTAGLAALVVHWNAPGRPGLALLGLCAVALLPLHIYVSPMPGNEMFLCLLTAAAAALFVANERRARPGLLTDAATGLLLGLCLLVKFTGLTALIALVAAVLAGPLLSTRPATALPRALARAALIAAVAVAIASPYYARNLQTFGTPFQLSREFSLVAEVERQQPPGERSWRDFVQLSPRLFTQPDPLAPHLIHSVWGTFYVSTWANVFRGTDVAATPALQRRAWRANGAMALLGILPSALALAGAALCARDVWRGRRRAVGIPMLMLAGATLGAYLFFAWILPRWPALRASYMLTASLPFAVFTARGAEAVIQRVTARARVGITAALVATGVGALWVGAESLVLPPRADAPATGAVHYYFGEYDAARTVYRRLLAAPYPVPWLDNLAAVELADGGATRARQLSARAVEIAGAAERGDPYRQGRLAAATALDGDTAAAMRLLDAVLATQPIPELLANRGALHALQGDRARAEADLRAALDAEPALVPAWRNLATLLDAQGRSAEARAAREGAARAARATPRGYPYGVGTGENLEWGVGRRPLLVLEDGALRVVLPADTLDGRRRARSDG